MNPALANTNRAHRRFLLSAEDRARANGKWGPWEHIPLPNGAPGNGWCRDVRTVHRNAVFAVLERPAEGGVRHLAISSFSGIRPTWWEAQRIKDELAGADATAVEVYPPHGEIVDGADMYHLWVLPRPLPFSLWSA